VRFAPGSRRVVVCAARTVSIDRAQPTTSLVKVINETVFFRAHDGEHGEELWTSDRLSAGTRMVKDIYPGSEGSAPSESPKEDSTQSTLCIAGSDGRSPKAIAVDGAVLFAANDGEHGQELWTSDGTSAGTKRVADIQPGAGGSTPRWITKMDGTALFAANDGKHGRELWKAESSSRTAPVELVTLEAQIRDTQVVLRWRTASERENDDFEVQRRMPGAARWNEVGFGKDTGPTPDETSYQFTDTSPPFEAAVLTYRLTHVDVDGNRSPLDSLTVRRSSSNELKLLSPFPNPARTRITVRYVVPEQREATLRIYDVLGRRVRTVRRGTVEAGRKQFQLDTARLPSGTYVLRLEAGGQARSQQFTVVR
jgi:ELWxxDGT repeat protein